MPQPQEKAQDLTHEIAIVCRDERLGEFALEGYRREIKKSIPNHDPRWHLCFAFLAANQWDEETAIREHEIALNLGGSIEDVHFNYLISLIKFARFDRYAEEVISKLLKDWPDSIESLSYSAFYCLTTGNLSKVKEIVAKAKRVFVHDEDTLMQFDAISHNVDVIRNSGLTDEAFGELNKGLSEYLKSIQISNVSKSFSDDPESGGVFEIRLNDYDDPEYAVKLNDEFFEFMSDKGSDFEWLGKLSICFTGNYNAN